MAEKLRPEEEAIYAAVGRALTTWARVEDALGKLFGIVLNPRNTSPAHAAYWAIASFEGRLKMTDRAVQKRASETPLIKTWLDIHEALGSNNTIRNQIAHGTAYLLWPTNKYPQGRWVLAPYHHARKRERLVEAAMKANPRARDLEPKEKLGLKQIEAIEKPFGKIEERLDDLRVIAERLACIQEDVPLADNPKDQGLLTALLARPKPPKS